jgi:hypothetical protein
MFIGLVERFTRTDARPLLYFGGCYRTLAAA